jgi:predicted porin
MKKSLITLAILVATSGAALAQSSITVYGIADIALGKAAAAGDSKVGAQSNSIVTNSNSRIGLTGKEDLGGGWSAGFRYEGSVNLATGAAGGGGPAGGPLFSRQATVSLHSNGLGTLKLGRAYAPGFDADAVWELTDEANYSVVANTYGFGSVPFPRNNAQLEYLTPSIAGFSAEVAYVPQADGGLLNGGYGAANQTDRWDLDLAYQQGPVAVALDVNKADQTNSVDAPGSDKTNYSLGGRYKFGQIFALAASYHHANMAQQWSNGRADGAGAVVFAKRYGYSLGGSATLGQFVLTLDLTRDTQNDLYTDSLGNHKKYTNGLLEAKYNLSKRTFLYADYLRLDGTNNYSLGMLHSF